MAYPLEYNVTEEDGEMDMTGPTTKRKPELGKFLLWRHFHQNAEIRPHLPETSRFSQNSFSQTLKHYKEVYVKPSGGSRGIGIHKAWLANGRVYVKETTKRPAILSGIDTAYAYIDKRRKGKPYIVQRGLRLAKIENRPFDIRVMVQRTSKDGPWLYSGMVAKIAGKSSVVTNVALSHGSVMPVDEALKRAFGLGPKDVTRKIELLKQVALLCANHFDLYQKYRELGFDMAFDTSGKLWVIEENTGPSHRLFKLLGSDLSMYRRIQFRYGQYTRAIKSKKTAGSESKRAW